MKLHRIYGKTPQARSDFLIDALLKKNESDPFSFLFLTPSGYFIKWIRERTVAKQEDFVFLSSQFKSIRSFAKELYKKQHPEKTYISDKVIKLNVARILKKEKGFSPSSGTVESFIQAIKLFKNNKEDYTETFGGEEFCFPLFQKVYDELDKVYRDENFYDSIDALNISDEQIRGISKNTYGDTLFIDGFYDLSPAMGGFIESIASIFEDVYISIPEDNNRNDLFEESFKLRKLFMEVAEGDFDDVYLKDSFIGVLSSFKKNLFSDSQSMDELNENVKAVLCNDLFGETDFICREIKRLIFDKGYEPEDIQVIVPGDEYLNAVGKAMQKFGIPYSGDDTPCILQSKAVRNLLLPFKTVIKNLNMNQFIKMIDVGYGNYDGKDDLNSVLFESVAYSAGLFQDTKEYPVTNIQNIWIEKIKKYKDFLRRKIDSLSNMDDDDFRLDIELRELRDRIEFIDNDMIPGINNIFSFLQIIMTNKRLPISTFKEFFIVCEKKSNLKEMLREFSYLKNEVINIDYFIQIILNDFEESMVLSGYEMLSSEEYYTNLLNFIGDYKMYSESTGGGVEIQSLVQSRNLIKKVKFFSGFSGDNYPSISLNPLYSKSQYSDDSDMDSVRIQERRQKLGLYLSICSSEERVYFTWANTDSEGTNNIRSIYIDSILSSAGQEEPIIYGRESGKRNDLMPRGDNIMSVEDLLTLSAKVYRGDYDRIESVFKSINKPFPAIRLDSITDDKDLKINNRRLLEETVGNTYSFSRINEYCNCNFKYFLDYLLKIETEVDEYIDLTALNRGSIIHAVLSDIFGKGIDLEESLRKHLLVLTTDNNKTLFDIRYDGLKQIIHDYVEFELNEIREKHPQAHVMYTELPFGMKGVKKCELMHNFFLRGSIDRVDQMDDGSIMIIDYKSGSTAGAPEQVILYSMAYERVYSSNTKVVSRGEFRLVKGKKIAKPFDVIYDENGRVWKFNGKVKFISGKKGEISDLEVLNWLHEVVKSINDGFFYRKKWDGKDPSCFFCDYKDICKVIKWKGEINE